MGSIDFGIGLNEVYAPESGNAPVAVICLVHGLFGGPWKTFEAKRRTPRGEKGASRDVFWPRDLLPNAVGNARVVSFGFDADVEKFMGAASLNTIHQHSRNLLNTMCDQLGSELPIIFVAHSLGGVIVKDALNQSAGATADQTRQRLLEKTHGIIFLGTPHRGSSSATYGRTAFRVSQFFAFQSANIKLITALERNSETLDRISTEFNESLAKNKNISLWSYAEERQVRFGVVGIHIVPPDSAKIGHDRERWGSISGDNRHIAKYSSNRDDGFVKVSSVLKQWVEDLSSVAVEPVQLEPGYEECLSSLDDPIARLRTHGVERVSQFNRGSLEWLYTNTVPFMDWLKDDYSRYDPLFWVTGKPGSGKSTLMRFALEDHRTIEAMPMSEGAPIAYFFHLHGSSLVQKSLKGMLQELLHEVLRQFPTFYSLVSQIHDRVRSSPYGSGWDVTSLSECLLKIPDLNIGSGSRARILIFIDALDENENQLENEKLVKLILDLSDTYCSRVNNAGRDGARPLHELPILKICLASRPWPVFKRMLGNKSRISSFAIHQYTEDDIRAYARLLLVQPFQYSQPPDPYYQRGVLELANDITKKAQGVIVWVRVVVDSSRRQIIDGTPIEALKLRIMGYPEELKDLYESTVQRIPKDYHRETEIVFKTLLGSCTPLSLAQLYVITQSCLGNSVSFDWKVSSETAAWLASRTGGMVEEILSSVHDTEVMFVQFIHQTVQEYVRGGAKGLELSPVFGFLEARICGIYLLIFACGANVDPSYRYNTDVWPGIEGSRYTHLSLLQPILRNLFTYLRACEAYADDNPDHGELLIDLVTRSLRKMFSESDGPRPNFDLMSLHLEDGDRASLSELLLELGGGRLNLVTDKSVQDIVIPKFSLMHRRGPKNQHPIPYPVSYSIAHTPKQKDRRETARRFQRATRVIFMLNTMDPTTFVWLMTITQNIYHFTLTYSYTVAINICQILAAVGPRFVSERTDRPRMLRRFTEMDHRSHEAQTYRFSPTWSRAVPKSLVVGPQEGVFWGPSTPAAHVLATAKPTPSTVDDKQLWEMTDMILSSMSSDHMFDLSKYCVFVRDPAVRQGMVMNLVIYCARHKANASECVRLLSQYGVTGGPIEVDLFDEIALNIAMSGGCKPTRRIEDISIAALYPSLFLLAPGMGGSSVLDSLKMLHQPQDEVKPNIETG